MFSCQSRSRRLLGATYGVKPQTSLEMPTSQHQPVANQQTPQWSVADLQSIFESSSQLPTTEQSPSPPSDQKLPLSNGKPSTRLQHFCFLEGMEQETKFLQVVDLFRKSLAASRRVRLGLRIGL
ncbi:hypothetical protein LINGRAHAP2_LOCUS2156 [Linum grandiflorum]